MGLTAILPPPKVVRCLMPLYQPHFCRPILSVARGGIPLPAPSQPPFTASLTSRLSCKEREMSTVTMFLGSIAPFTLLIIFAPVFVRLHTEQDCMLYVAACSWTVISVLLIVVAELFFRVLYDVSCFNDTWCIVWCRCIVLLLTLSKRLVCVTFCKFLYSGS